MASGHGEGREEDGAEVLVVREPFYLTVSKDFFGLRIWRFYFTVKSLRTHRPYFSERNRIRCRYVTVGHVRFKVQYQA